MPPINNLLRQLLNDERIVQKLQDSKPIREAAKATVAVIQKGKEHVQDLLDKLKENESDDKPTERLKEKNPENKN